jgi:toxin ParE1/3/4
MRLRIARRPQARRDIVATALYIAEDSPDATRRFVAALERTIAAAAAMPGMGAPRRYGHPKLEGLRMIAVGGFEKHLVFYRPTEAGIEIVRVLHAARDIEAALTGKGRGSTPPTS